MGAASQAYLNAVERALELKGQAQENAALTKGQIWSNFLNQIGQLGSQAVQGISQYEQDKKITDLFTNQWNAFQNAQKESTPFVGPIDPRTPEGAALGQMADLSPAANYTMPGAMGAPPPTLPQNVQRTFGNLFPQSGATPPIQQPGLNQLSTAGLFASPSAQSIKFAAAPPSPTETAAPPTPSTEPSQPPASTPPVSTAADQTPMPTRAQMEDPKHPYLWLMQFANTPEEKQAVLDSDKSGGKTPLPDAVLTRVAAAYGGTYKPPAPTSAAPVVPPAIPVAQLTAPAAAPVSAPAPVPTAPPAAAMPTAAPPMAAAPTQSPYVPIPPPGMVAPGAPTYRAPLPPFVPPTVMTGASAVSPFPSFGQIIKVAGVPRGIQIINGIQALMKDTKGDPKLALEQGQALFNGLAAMPEELRPATYEVMRESVIRSNAGNPALQQQLNETLPLHYTPEMAQYFAGTQLPPSKDKTESQMEEDFIRSMYGTNPSGPQQLEGHTLWQTAKQKSAGLSPSEMDAAAQQLLSQDILSKQTGPDGQPLAKPLTPQQQADLKAYQLRKTTVTDAAAAAASERQASAQEQQNKIQQQEHDFKVQQAGRAEIKSAEIDARKQVGTANLLRGLVSSAKAGNEISAGVQPLASSMALIRAEGLNRINTVEIGSTADAGSLEDRILNGLGKLAKGQPFDAKLQQDMLDFADLLERQANWSYRSAFSAAVDNYGLTNIKMRPELAGPEPWTDRGGTKIRKVP